MIAHAYARRAAAPALVVGAISFLIYPSSSFANEPEAAGEPAAGESAQESDLLRVDDEIVVSAGLQPIEKRRTGSSVTVLDREEIERRNKTTVLELLRSVPGLAVAQTGGPGKTASVFIRGGNSAHTLVTVDGVRVNANSTGAFDFADLSPDNLERIEVLRGPQGVLYGSEAVAGVISILTRSSGTSGPAKIWAKAAVGNDDYGHLAAGVRGGDDRLHYSLVASRLETDGVSAASEENGNTETDAWENLTVSGSLGGQFLANGSWNLALRHTEGDTDLDGFTFGVGPTDDLNSRQERETTSASLTLSQAITDRWSQSLVVGTSHDSLLGEDPDDFFSNFEIEDETAVVRTQADLKLSERGSLSVGYQVERRQTENAGSFDESLYLRSFFAENLWSWGDAGTLSLGLRNDDHSVFGNETSYRVAASVRLSPAARLHGSAGTGFKAPTFNDLFFPGFGNPNLEPETSEGYDLGVEFSASEGRLTVDLTYFDTSFEDLILFTFPAGFVNVAEAESSGAELTVDWRASDRFELRASHTYNDTEDVSSGLQLARRPENRSTLDLFFEPIERLRATASLLVVRDRIDSDTSPMDDYERVDLNLDYELNDRFRPFLRIENLFDQDYAEIPGFTTPGATFAVGLTVSR